MSCEASHGAGISGCFVYNGWFISGSASVHKAETKHSANSWAMKYCHTSSLMFLLLLAPSCLDGVSSTHHFAPCSPLSFNI